MDMTVLLISAVLALLVFFLLVRLLKALLAAAVLALAVAVCGMFLLPHLFDEPVDVEKALQQARTASEKVMDGAKGVGQSTTEAVDNVRSHTELVKSAEQAAEKAARVLKKAKKATQQVVKGAQDLSESAVGAVESVKKQAESAKEALDQASD